MPVLLMGSNNQEAKFEKLCGQVNEIHTTVFGAQNQGGMLREQATMKKEIEDLKQTKWKALGIATGVSAFLSFLVAWVNKNK